MQGEAAVLGIAKGVLDRGRWLTCSFKGVKFSLDFFSRRVFHRSSRLNCLFKGPGLISLVSGSFFWIIGNTINVLSSIIGVPLFVN